MLFTLASALRIVFLQVTLGSFAFASNAPVSFQITSGGNDNFFYRDNLTSAQILLTIPNNSDLGFSRLVSALPAGNSGALVYFLPKPDGDEQKLVVSLVNGTLTSTTDDFNNSGIQADLSLSRNATLGVTIVGAVRAMRGASRTHSFLQFYLNAKFITDYVEGGGSMNPIFNYTLGKFNESSVWLHHRYINSSTASGSDSSNKDQNLHKYTSLHLSVPPDESATRFRVTPNTVNGSPTIDIYSPMSDSNSTQIRVRIRVLSNETSLDGLDSSSLFLNESQATTPGILKALQRLEDGASGIGEAAEQVRIGFG
jgi:hypothetical protein